MPSAAAETRASEGVHGPLRTRLALAEIGFDVGAGNTVFRPYLRAGLHKLGIACTAENQSDQSSPAGRPRRSHSENACRDLSARKTKSLTASIRVPTRLCDRSSQL